MLLKRAFIVNLGGTAEVDFSRLLSLVGKSTLTHPPRLTCSEKLQENPTNSFFLKVSRAVKSGQDIHSSDSTPRQGFRTKTELSRLRARVQELLKQQSRMTLSVSILPITKLRISKTFRRSQAVLSAISVTQ